MLEIRNLDLAIHGKSILAGISLSLKRGKILGIIGESGSGKSMTANAIMQLLPHGSKTTGQILFENKSLSELSETQMNALRGNDISMIFQEPMTALNPLKTIGDQVAETVLVHGKADRVEAARIAQQTLARIGLPTEKFPASRYPHELSGGQRQRVVIAMAIALKPKLLIADEPTSALDVTTQAQILALLRQLVEEDNIGLVLISHDLAVVHDMADHIAIMQAGRIVEVGPTKKLFKKFSHPYSKALLAASGHQPERTAHSSDKNKFLLEAQSVSCDYPLPRKTLFGQKRFFRAVDEVSFTIKKGESLGLVGQSGCGKSTLARAILGLEPIKSGRILLDGKPLAQNGKITGANRRKMQMVFQDPYGSFNPRHTVFRLISEPFHLLENAPIGLERQKAVDETLESVGLPASASDKYVHEFSGGQRQRLAIARALIIRPELIVLDEPVSALDVSIEAKILDLLTELGERYKLAYLFISHDLSVVRAITDRVLVMDEGKIVEQGETRSVFEAPQHAYTKALIRAVPSLPKAA